LGIKFWNFKENAFKIRVFFSPIPLKGALGGKGGSPRKILEKFFLRLNSYYLSESKLSHIPLDADSTVSIVYGNQKKRRKGIMIRNLEQRLIIRC